MGQGYQVQIGKARPTGAEAREAAAAEIEQNPGLAIQPHQIARAGSPVLALGAAGAEHLHGDCV
ncbi:hypothetical protein Thiowin_03877 [Thiorhodovibrio winogradskyi]|uniref:Uncharacterized protein n=1 Tax=Thiorhodovibrio winogradskyi TaxID=77007 RepID=A0ABZ0SCN7_9GAMM